MLGMEPWAPWTPGNSYQLSHIPSLPSHSSTQLARLNEKKIRKWLLLSGNNHVSRPSPHSKGRSSYCSLHTHPFPRRCTRREGTLLLPILCHSEGGWVTAAHEVNSRQPEKESFLTLHSLGQLPSLALRLWLTVDPILASAQTTPASVRPEHPPTRAAVPVWETEAGWRVSCFTCFLHGVLFLTGNVNTHQPSKHPKQSRVPFIRPHFPGERGYFKKDHRLSCYRLDVPTVTRKLLGHQSAQG